MVPCCLIRIVAKNGSITADAIVSTGSLPQHTLRTDRAPPPGHFRGQLFVFMSFTAATCCTGTVHLHSCHKAEKLRQHPDEMDCLRWISGAGGLSWRLDVGGEAVQLPLTDLLVAHYQPRAARNQRVREAARSLKDLSVDNATLCRLTIEAIEQRVDQLKVSNLSAGHLPPCINSKSSTPDARFPSAFSPSFETLCGPFGLGSADWRAAQNTRDCGGEALYAATVPTPSEGLSLFVTQAASAAFRAAQQHLGLILIYSHAELSRAIQPAGVLDWREGARAWPMLNHLLGRCESTSQRQPGRAQLDPRAIRHTFRKRAGAVGPMGDGDAPLPSETATARALASACTLNAIFQPREDVVPAYASIRDALNAEDTLSIGLYIRTGMAETNHRYAESALRSECAAESTPRSLTWRERYQMGASVLCALELERRWAAGFKRVVWFLASDDASLRAQIQANYDETSTGGRSVLHTATLGRHTRPSAYSEVVGGGEAFQSSLNEALADWWLLGETDVAVLSTQMDAASFAGGGFGATAFSRTARTQSVFAPAALAGISADDASGEPTVQLTECGDARMHLSMFS